MEEASNETQTDGDDNSSDLKSEQKHLLNNETTVERNNTCSSWCSKINITIEPAICAVFLAINLCDIVITNLIMDRTCQVELHLNKSECSLLGNDTDEGHRVEALVQPYATLLTTGKSLITSIVPAILSLFLGPWSDVHGRKFLLLLPMLGLAMTYLANAVVSYFSHLRPEYFLLAALPFSFSGGFINLISAAYAYISDVSCEENRALRLGVMEASIFIGLLIGQSCSYRLFKSDTHFGYIITLSTGALISLLAFLYTMAFVRESVDRNQESQIRQSLFQMKYVKDIFLTSFKKRENHGRTLICLSLVVMIIMIVVMEGEANLLYFFTRLRFGWKFPQFMTWSTVFIATRFVGLIIGCVILTKLFKIPDNALVLGSCFMRIVECIFYALIPSNSPHLLYWAQLIGILGGVAGPALRSVVSKLVPKGDVGKVFFLATSFESLFPLAITPMYTALYNLTMNTFPGAFFLLSACLFLLNFVLFCIVSILQKRLMGEGHAPMSEEVD